MASKIAELKFEAPLACFEEEDSSSLRNMNIFSGMLFIYLGCFFITYYMCL
jgi:hypothetical protein